MQRIPDIFSRYTTQLWYILMIPFFFFGFIVVYRPFDMSTALDMGRGLFFINASIMMGIVLVWLLITRTLFHLLYRHLSHNWWQFIAWCFLELTGLTYFFALYLFLISRHALPYFEQLAVCLQYTFLVLAYPYIIITTICVVSSLTQKGDVPQSKDLIRFQDASRQVRLILDKDAVLFIKAEENYVRIHYLDNGRVKDYQLRATMAGIESLVQKYGLFRCQRSYFVNPAHITALRKDVNNMITAELDADGYVIPVSRALYKDLTHLL